VVARVATSTIGCTESLAFCQYWQGARAGVALQLLAHLASNGSICILAAEAWVTLDLSLNWDSGLPSKSEHKLTAY
jgi:hypothetical protein